MIACVVLPDVVSLVEGQTNPNIVLLNSMGKVQAASSAAVRSGVRRFMRAQQAITLCSEIEMRSLDETRYLA